MMSSVYDERHFAVCPWAAQCWHLVGDRIWAMFDACAAVGYVFKLYHFADLHACLKLCPLACLSAQKNNCSSFSCYHGSCYVWLIHRQDFLWWLSLTRCLLHIESIRYIAYSRDMLWLQSDGKAIINVDITVVVYLWGANVSHGVLRETEPSIRRQICNCAVAQCFSSALLKPISFNALRFYIQLTMYF